MDSGARALICWKAWCSMAICERCGQKDAVRKYCPECRQLARAEYMQANSQKYHPPRERRFNCPDCGVEIVTKSSRKRCQECARKARLPGAREYKKANRERLRGYDNAYYDQNRGRIYETAQERRYGRNWRQALARDGHKCTECGATEQLVIHHKDGRGRTSQNPNHDLDNLQTVCRSCHARIHKEQLHAV